MPFHLRPASAEDQVFLAELFHEVHSAEFSPLQLPPAALAQLLDMQFRGQQMSYQAQFPAAEDHIFLVDGRRAGRMLVDRSSTAVRVIDIALLSEFRGCGIGRASLEKLAEEAKVSGLPLQLSVRFGNPAQRLYERLGFVRTGGDGVNVFMELSPWRQPQENAENGVTESLSAAEAPGDAAPGTSSRYFRGLVGETLLAGAENIPLRLTRVEAIPVPPGGAPVQLNDSFIVRLEGPPDRILPSACTDLQRANGETLNIFLVPTGPEGGAMQYEAIFNRMQ